MSLDTAQRRGLAWAALSLAAALLLWLLAPVSALIQVALRRARAAYVASRLFPG
jgi:hypothetical protein